MFCGLSVLPEFFEKRMNVFMAVAPVATLSKLETPVIKGFAFSKTFIDVLTAMDF